MTKKPWLALSPLVFLLGLGSLQNVIASPLQIADCANCLANNDSANNNDNATATPTPDSDYDGTNNFDNDSDLSQDQSTNTSQGPAPAQPPPSNAPDQSSGDED